MKKLYFRDDRQASGRYLAGTVPMRRGVLFGLAPEEGDAEDAAVLWRVEWHAGPTGRPAWRFGLAYAGDARLETHPALRERLDRLPPTVSVNEFCAALEQLGFVNGHDPSGVVPAGMSIAPGWPGDRARSGPSRPEAARRSRLY